MAVSFERYLEHIIEDNVRRPIIKIELLRYEDETVFDTITGYAINENSTLNIENKNGQRRSIGLELINTNKHFLPSPDGIWLRQKIKVWAGLTIDSEEKFFPMGVFVVQDPTAVSQLSDKRFSLTATDKFSLADGSVGGETEGIYNIPVGTSIPDAIRLVLQPSDDAQREVFYDPKEPIVDVSFDSDVTPYTIEIADGAPVGDILFELATQVSANIYYGVDGRLIFERDEDDSNKGPQFNFEAGDFNFMGGSQRFYNSKVYNAVNVVGANINGDIASAYLENNNLLSDTSIPNVGWKRVKKIEDPNISTDALALTRAKYELKRTINLQSENTFSCVPIYHLDVDGIITLTDDDLNLNKERNLINSISLPLSTGGTMSITCAKSIDLIISE